MINICFLNIVQFIYIREYILGKVVKHLLTIPIKQIRIIRNKIYFIQKIHELAYFINCILQIISEVTALEKCFFKKGEI